MQLNALLNKFNIQRWEESQTLEWKTSSSEAKEIVRTVAAFANSTGGYIVVGVDDKGTLVGQDVSDSTIRALSQTILGNTEEKVDFLIEKLIVESKQLIIISVSQSPLRPHLAYGRALKRVGTIVTSMEQSEYHLLLGQKTNGGGADKDLCSEATIDDINQTTLSDFLTVANDRRSTNFSLLTSPETILTNLELMNSGILLKGALLLFGHNPQKFVPQAEFRLAHFEDTSRNVFLDQVILTGTLFSQLEQSLQFIKSKLPEKINTLKEGTRVDRVPSMAVFTEIIANALIHRDYRSGGSSYLNIIGTDEVEIINPGILPAPTITPEVMHLPHISLPFNRRLARVFFLAGLIEQWGEGTRRVCELMKQSSLPIPVWKSERGVVTVVLQTKSHHL